MANENLNINVNVNDNGASNTLGGLEKKLDDVKNSTDKLDNSSKTLKAQLREVINEMGKYDEGSEAFKKAAVKAANLRERISDMNDTIKAFNPEQKFKAFEGVIGGVANGFSAAQGAMALFGDENKNLEETIKKTQGAMALAQGVNGLLGLGDAFKNLSTIIQTNVLMAFNKLKIILLENPITAIAVAIAALIALWVAYNQKVGDVVDTNKKLVETSDNVIKSIEDETKKLKEQNIELALNLEAKKGGITTDEQRLKNINNEITSNQKLIDDYRKNYGLEKGFIDSNTQSVQVKIDLLKKEGKVLEDIITNNKSIKKIDDDNAKSIKANSDAIIAAKAREVEQQKEIARNLKVNTENESSLIDETTKTTAKIIDNYIEDNNLSLSKGQITYLGDLKKQVLDFDKTTQDMAIKSIKNMNPNMSVDDIKKSSPYFSMLELIQTEEEEKLVNLLDNVSFLGKKEQLWNKIPFIASNTNNSVIKAKQDEANKELEIDLEKFLGMKEHQEDFNKFVSSTAEERKIMLKSYNDKDNKERADEYDKKIKDDKELAVNQKQLVEKTSQELGGFFSAMSANQKQGSAEQKAFAIASIAANEAVAISTAAAAAFAGPENTLTGGVSGAVKLVGFLALLGTTFARIDSVLSSGSPTSNNQVEQNLAPRRKFAGGGILNGPSHQNGGITTPFGELEGGELVLNKNVGNNNGAKVIASALNKQFGGVDFANSGEIIKVQIANPQNLTAVVSDRTLNSSKSF